MSKLLNEIQNAYLGNENKIALVIGDNHYSYSELSTKTIELASLLAHLNISKNEHIAVILPNGIDFIITMLASAQIGCAIVPMPLGITLSAFKQACKDTDIKHVICWAAVSNTLKPSELESTFNNWISVTSDGILTHQQAELSINKNSVVTAEDNSPFILTMTSGSTGKPKPIVLSQKTKLLRAQSAISLYQLKNDDVTLIATPLYHSLAERLVMVALLSGGTAVLMEKFSIEQWLKNIETYRVSFTIAVSSQLKQLLNTVQFSTTDLTSLTCLVSSSALLEKQVKMELLKNLQCEFHECYGASEIAIATNIKFDAKDSSHTVGAAIKGVEIAIIDNKNNILLEGATGEIVCKTPLQFDGYYKQDSLTNASFVNGYFKTGDIGTINKQGELTFLGRSKDVIITGGINVYPSDVEAVALTLKNVKECAAFSFPDEHLGEVVGLALILEDAGKANFKNIIRGCAIELSDFQLPRHYIILENLPKTALGKVEKYKIFDMANKIINTNPSNYSALNFRIK